MTTLSSFFLACLHFVVAGHWVQNQRKLAHTLLLDEEQVRLLHELNFAWSGHQGRSQRTFHKKYEQIQEYYQYFGHLEGISDRGIRQWMHHLRRDYWNGTLDPEYKAKLDEIHFRWEKTVPPDQQQQLRRSGSAVVFPIIQYPLKRDCDSGDKKNETEITDRNGEEGQHTEHSLPPPTKKLKTDLQPTTSPEEETSRPIASVVSNENEPATATTTAKNDDSNNTNSSSEKSDQECDEEVDPILKHCEEEWEAELEEGVLI